MNNCSRTLLAASIALAGASAFAMDDMKKDGMAKDGMMKNDTMTAQQCKDHMAMSSKAGTKKDDAMMKKDAMCADMMKKDGMAKSGGAMHSDNMASGAMKK